MSTDYDLVFDMCIPHSKLESVAELVIAASSGGGFDDQKLRGLGEILEQIANEWDKLRNEYLEMQEKTEAPKKTGPARCGNTLPALTTIKSK
jgi:hypothetical protein